MSPKEVNTTEDDQNPPKFRSKILERVLHKALANTTQELSSKKFDMCYPQISANDIGKQHLQVARKQMITFWETSAMTEFDKIFKERSVESKLDELDKLIWQAQKRKETGAVEESLNLEDLTPEKLIQSQTIQDRRELRDNLQTQVTFLEKQTQQLLEDFEKEAQTSSETINSIEAKLAHLNMLLSLMENDSQPPLRERLDKLVDGTI
ncbi:BA75_02430T0 [Komagataella pastoris]|uniref:BA75_02430T0 n=1 Tax=Komagataella pastoris TaxID=4922 RepID=A0A1B2JB99_PICPA|nr:BA75_02430T0 [Komagataella pastoris]